MVSQKSQIRIELLLVEELKKLGYPQDAILPDWKYKNHYFDITVFDPETQIPLMVIECKREGDRNRLEMAIAQLRKYSSSLDYPVRMCVAMYTGGGLLTFMMLLKSSRASLNRQKICARLPFLLMN